MPDRLHLFKGAELSEAALLQQTLTLPDGAAQAGQASPGKKKQLANAALRLGELGLAAVSSQFFEMLPQVAQRYDDVLMHRALDINIVPVGMLVMVPDPSL